VSCIFWSTVFLSLLNIYALRARHLDNCSCVILPSAILSGRMPFSNESLGSTYFFATAKKSKQKRPRGDPFAD
jgi:hypothetical protein